MVVKSGIVLVKLAPTKLWKESLSFTWSSISGSDKLYKYCRNSIFTFTNKSSCGAPPVRLSVRSTIWIIDRTSSQFTIVFIFSNLALIRLLFFCLEWLCRQRLTGPFVRSLFNNYPSEFTKVSANYFGLLVGLCKDSYRFRNSNNFSLNKWKFTFYCILVHLWYFNFHHLFFYISNRN